MLSLVLIKVFFQKENVKWLQINKFSFFVTVYGFDLPLPDP